MYYGNIEYARTNECVTMNAIHAYTTPADPRRGDALNSSQRCSTKSTSDVGGCCARFVKKSIEMRFVSEAENNSHRCARKPDESHFLSLRFVMKRGRNVVSIIQV